MTTSWQYITTKQRIEAIKSVWYLGASASDIGAALGITRNAVIGMYGRHKAALKDYPLGGGERPAQAKANSQRNQTARQKRKRLKAIVKTASLVKPDDPRYVTLLENNGCKWPVNDRDKDGQHLFCGHPRMEGTSPDFPYCGRHAGLACQHPGTGQDNERIAA